MNLNKVFAQVPAFDFILYTLQSFEGFQPENKNARHRAFWEAQNIQLISFLQRDHPVIFVLTV
jgi:hypothetical protein